MNEGERKLCEWQYEMTGSFYTTLFKAMSSADSFNLARLAIGFPEEVNSLQRFRNEEGYWESLQKEFKIGV